VAGRPRKPGSSTALLAAAVAALRERGYDGLVLEDVARTAGTGKSSLYSRFADRHALAVAAVASLQRDPPPPMGELRLDLIALVRTAERDLSALGPGTLGSLLARPANGAAPDNGGLLAPTAARCRRLLTSARERGELPAGADPESAVELIVGSLLVRMLAPALSPGPWPDRAVDALLAVMRPAD
jgi:AcrR family transcriptional regulator